MSVIETPVREQTVIEIEQNDFQNKLDEMVSYVKSGRWCRDVTRDDSVPTRHCAIGLVFAKTGTRLTGCEQYRLMQLLDQAIPEGALEGMEAGDKLNGGTVRGTTDTCGRVASYNNTREGEHEIIDWFERTKLIA